MLQAHQWLLALPVLFTSILNGYFDSHYLKFYLEQKGMAPLRFSLVGTIISSLDLFMDIFMGNIVDRIGPGRLTLIGAPLVSISIVALFTPLDLSQDGLFLWVLFWNFIKTSFPLHIAYQALCSLSSSSWESGKRNDFFAIRHVMGIIGGILANFIPYFLKKDSMVFIIIVTIFYSLVFLILSRYFHVEPVNTDSKEERPNFIVGIRQCLHNSAFTVLLYLAIWDSFRALFWAGLFPLYLTYVIGLHGQDYDLWMGIYGISGLIFSGLGTPIWIWMQRKVGTKKVWMISFICQMPIGVFVYWLCDNPRIYLFFYIWNNAFAGSSGFLGDSIKTMVYDYNNMLIGQRSDASIDASLRFFPRYISLFGTSVSYGIISYCGYIPNQSQIPAVVRCVAIMACLVPCFTTVVNLYLMSTFPLDDDVMDGLKEVKYDDITPSADPISGLDVNTLKDRMKKMSDYFEFEEPWIRSGFYSQRIFCCISSFIAVTCISCLLFGIFDEMFKILLVWIASVSFTLAILFYTRIGTKIKSE